MHWISKLDFEMKRGGKCAPLCVLWCLSSTLVHSELEEARLEAGGLDG